MATFEASIVTRFGDDVDSSTNVVYELDEVKNIDAAGNVKTEFTPPDVAWFLVNIPAGLRVTKATTSAGSVQVLGQVKRDRSQDLQFTAAGDTVTISYNRISDIAPTWEGRDGMITRNDLVLTAAAAPAIGTLAYKMEATQCRFLPPSMGLAVNERRRILIVVYIDTV